MSGKVYAKNIHTRRISRVSREAFRKMQESLEYESAGSWERKYNEFLKPGAIWPLEQAIHLLAGEDPDDPRWGSNFNNSRTPDFKKIRKVLDEDYRLCKITLTETKSIDGTILGAENIVFIKWAMTKDFATRLPEVFIEFLEENLADNEIGHVIKARPELNSENNSFIIDDDFCLIRFNALELKPIKKSKGLVYIQFLLKNPNQEIPATILSYDFASISSIEVTEILAVEELENFRQSGDIANFDKILDPKYIKDLKKGKEYLEDQIERAKLAENDDRVEKLEEDLKKIVHQLDVFLRQGKSKSFPTPTRRCTDAVQHAIRDGIDKFIKLCPELHKHLDKSIVTRSPCLYQPTEKIKWRLCY